MDNLEILTRFFQTIENDFRIGTTHIAIFAALLQFRASKDYINPILAYSIEIQKISKVVSPKTYHRCMHDLDKYGYLVYVPTKNKNKRSSIYFHLD
ncbi:hypothetical protein NLG42_19330 [Flavobacterium plurextorum]|uniref:hypothetical protein n=1 Tax=Flavobacterium TaxID=237 RepID=UPI00214DA075|nr:MULTISPECIES: hypothetical protein [Flavobacterium]UUW08247.1 hypothetical protein NLG42_19330 [Flavobacterium plurextorum]